MYGRMCDGQQQKAARLWGFGWDGLKGLCIRQGVAAEGRASLCLGCEWRMLKVFSWAALVIPSCSVLAYVTLKVSLSPPPQVCAWTPGDVEITSLNVT